MLLLSLAACLSLYFRCASSWALPWIMTTYYVEEITTLIQAITFTAISETDSALIETNIVGVIPTVTPIPTLSVVTTIAAYESDLTLVEVLLPTGAGSTVGDHYSLNPTTYYVELFYTAPSLCPSRWVYSTTVFVDAPFQVTFAPTSVSTVFTQLQAFGPTSTEYFALINPTDIPTGDLSSLSSEYAPFFTDSCSIPYEYTATGTSPGSAASATPEPGGLGNDSGGSSSNSSNGDDWLGCDPFVWYFGGIQMGQGYICDNGVHYTQGISIQNFVLAWIFSWLGLFLIVGLIESYVTFSRLARGRKARRGMPIAFACLLPVLSCFFLCCSNRGYTAKSPEEQRLLTEQWEKTPFYTRIGRWLQWGFRYKYPPYFGAAPARCSNWGDKATTINRTPLVQTSGTTTSYAVATNPVEMEQPQQHHEMLSPEYYEMPSPDVTHMHEKPGFDLTTMT